MPERAVRLGSITWSYADWKGVFYPEKVKPDEMLSRYARVFDLVEIDNTFYRMPTTENAQAWVDATPDDFRFTVKLRNTLLTPAALPTAQDGVAFFLDRLKPMRDAGKLAAVVAQFPPFFRRGEKTGPIFDAFVRALPRDVRWAVEFRHDSWFTEETYAPMRESGASLVWSLRDIGVDDWPTVTADWLYTRFMGPRDLEKFDRIQRDFRPRIEAWKNRLDDFPEIKEVYGLTSSRFMGFAPETIRVIQDVLGMPQTDLSPAMRDAKTPGLGEFF